MFKTLILCDKNLKFVRRKNKIYGPVAQLVRAVHS